MKVDSVKYATKGNIAIEGGDGEPCAKEVSGDKACDPIPDLRRNALKGGTACEMNLRRKYYYVTGDEQCTDERQAPDANAFGLRDKTCRSWKPSENLRRATEACAPNRLRSQRCTRFERSTTNHEVPSGCSRSSYVLRLQRRPWVSPEFLSKYLGILSLQGYISSRRTRLK
jgi:hypothetical protein